MSIKRILVIPTIEMELNGITSVIMNYYRNIDKDKIQFDFAVGEGIKDIIKQEIESLGGKVYILPRRKKELPKYIKEVKRIIKENNYEIVHAHGNSGTLFFDIYAAKKGGAKKRIAHSHTTQCKHKIAHKILKRPLNKLMTDGIACSEAAGEWLFDKEFTVINNGVDLNKFKFDTKVRDDIRKELNLNDKFVIGHIGSFVEVKNHSYILDIFKEVSVKNEDAFLILIGDGYLRNEIEEKIEALNLKEKVMLLGNREDVHKIVQGMDLFLFPSLYEGLPVSLVEIQASGLKSVVSDVVTKECNMTNRMDFMDINENPILWAEKIDSIEKEYKRDDVFEIMESSKFNIKQEVKKLENLYFR